jgi:hypothetical protein
MIAMNADVAHVLNFRTRGHAARIERLRNLGAPVDTFDPANPYTGDREALTAWGQVADDREHEAAGGVYHACTVRTSSGCDAELPTINKIGCRISRVPIKAYLVEAGEVVSTDAYGEEWLAEESFWNVCWGSVGGGWMAPSVVSFDHAETAAKAEAIVRRRLLKGDCFTTRAAARIAVEKMLHERAGA